MARHPGPDGPHFPTTSARCDFVRAAALRAFAFLVEAGFAPAPEQDECTPTGVNVHFVGAHRAFLLSYDARDDAFTLYMREVTGGIAGNRRPPLMGWHVWHHLVERHGYRGALRRDGRSGSDAGRPQARLEAEIRSWAELLAGPGRVLVDDAPVPD